MLNCENLITSLDHFNTAIYLKSNKGHYTSMNTTGLHLMKDNHQQILGRTAYDLFDFKSATKMVESDQYTMLKKGVFTSVFDAKDKKTGHPMPIFTAKTSILSPSGEALGILGLSLVGYNDANLFAEACRLLPRFVQTKQTHILNELLELKTVTDFFKRYQLH
jgi:hypothetical protein